jgi:sirohydrochlorin cobaltochelatase
VTATSRHHGLFLIGHGTRSIGGAAELRALAKAVASARPGTPTAAGFIEFMDPQLDEAYDALVATGVGHVVAVPLVLLGAGHLKDDGPAALTRARVRHPAVACSYARELGLHPDILASVGERVHAASMRLANGVADAVVIVGRGSTDPDANADLAKAARLLADGRNLAPGLGDNAGAPPSASDSVLVAPSLGIVEPAFVSLARPNVTAALGRCAALGAKRIVVVPYFLFTGLLIDRIERQARAWGELHPGTEVVLGAHMGVDPRLVELVWERFDEASGGPVHMNCDGCLYRAPLPGYEHRLGAAPFSASEA